jgi:predicted nuclease with TOPRIM domain
LAVSDEKITLELLGARVMALTADVRDLQNRFTGVELRLSALEQRFSGLEQRFSGLEQRFSAVEGRLGVLEDRVGRVLALVVRIAERQGIGPHE